MSRSKEMDLTTGSPFWSLLTFAIPVILGNLFQLFYTLADSVIVGKTLGAQSLAAVGSTSIIIYFVFCFINGFTGGFGICLGQNCGAKNEKGMRKSVAVSTILSVLFTIGLTVLCCVFSHEILYLMQIPSDIYEEAYEYMFIVLLGTGATVFYNMISNMLRALGDSKTPLYFLVFSSILNIFLDLLFILPLHMGVSGAAWATILSQFLSALLSLLVGLFPITIYTGNTLRFQTLSSIFPDIPDPLLTVSSPPAAPGLEAIQPDDLHDPFPLFCPLPLSHHVLAEDVFPDHTQTDTYAIPPLGFSSKTQPISLFEHIHQLAFLLFHCKIPQTAVLEVQSIFCYKNLPLLKMWKIHKQHRTSL